VTACYAFTHVLYQQAVYARLGLQRRAHLHQRLGTWLEAASGPQAQEFAAELALHFERGGASRRAVQYYQWAATTAAQRAAPHAVAATLTRALDLLQTWPETAERLQQELEVLVALGPALMAMQGFLAPDVVQVYRRAHVVCQSVGAPLQRCAVLWGLWLIESVRGAHQTARGLAEDLLHLAQHLAEPAWLLRASYALGSTLLWLGAFADARAHLEQGIGLYDSQPHRFQALGYEGAAGVDCRSLAARALWMLGYPDQALQRTQEALTLAQELAHPYSRVAALLFAAQCHQLRREGHAVSAQAEAALVLITEWGFRGRVEQGMILQGWALADQGQGPAGLLQIRQGLTARQTLGVSLARPYYLGLCAETYGKVGQPAEGERLLAEALAVVHTTGERIYEAELYRLQGELLLAGASAQQVEAAACFQQALAIARRQQAKSWGLRAAMSLARLWQHQGQRAEAHALLAPIYGWFTEGFDTADLQEAKALLAAVA